MRARAGDPPRTMTQKILAGRSADPSLSGELVQVKVDQVVLARAPAQALAEAVLAGLKKTSVETAIAYERHVVTEPGTPLSFETAEMLSHGAFSSGGPARGSRPLFTSSASRARRACA